MSKTLFITLVYWLDILSTIVFIDFMFIAVHHSTYSFPHSFSFSYLKAEVSFHLNNNRTWWFSHSKKKNKTTGEVLQIFHILNSYFSLSLFPASCAFILMTTSLANQKVFLLSEKLLISSILWNNFLHISPAHQFTLLTVLCASHLVYECIFLPSLCTFISVSFCSVLVLQSLSIYFQSKKKKKKRVNFVWKTQSKMKFYNISSALSIPKAALCKNVL